jgi:hypothetical protein
MSLSIIVLMNINTKVVAQNQNSNDILINDVETIFINMQKKVQEYLQITYSTNTDVTNITSILALANLNLVTAIKKYTCVIYTTTKTTVTTISTSTSTTPALTTRPTNRGISFIIITRTTSSTRTTTSTGTVAIVTTTANLLSFICQSYSGVRLNETAISQLSYLISYNYTTTSSLTDYCCSRCNLMADCDYAFEYTLSTNLNSCFLYHWQLPPGLSKAKIAYEIKQGFWFQRKSFSITSGKLIFSNKFILFNF